MIVKILILEDYIPDAELNVIQLKKEKLDFTHKIVSSRTNFEKALIDYKPDLILSDYNLPQYNGLEALDFVKTNCSFLPFIIVTGSLDEETAAECIKQGAWDYVIKERLVRLGPAVRNALSRKKELIEKAKSEKRFEQFANLLPEIVCEADIDGRLTYLNEIAYQKFGYNRKDVEAGINLFSVIAPQDIARARDNFLKLFSGDVSGSDEYLMLKRNGEAFPAIVHANVIWENNLPIGIRAVVVDISEQKKNEEKNRLIIENSPIGVSTTNIHGQFLTVNDTFAKILGYNTEELIGRHFNEITHPEDIEKNIELNKKLLNSEIDFFDLEKRYIRQNGEIIYCRIRSQLVRSPEGKPLFEIAVSEDITEKKKALDKLKEREEFSYALFQKSPIETLVVDKSGKIISWNLAVEKNRSHPPQKGDELYKDYAAKHESDIYAVLQNCLKTGESAHISESRYEDKYYDISIAPFEAGAIITAIDITPLKSAEYELRQSLSEKEVLLKEVHHRVKNNMQIVSSLLRLQQRYTQNQEAIAILGDCYRRVYSMATIHEKLYQSGDFSRINFKSYLSKLIGFILSFGNQDNSRITYSIEAEEIFLNINQSIPCGLIINELITNSIKHAFPDEKKGKIWISIFEENNNYILTYQDDGIGFALVEKDNEEQSLGLQLVFSLSEQLKGKIEFNGDKGCFYRLIFEKE
jgi:PAS domain S-box-containing protein